MRYGGREEPAPAAGAAASAGPALYAQRAEPGAPSGYPASSLPYPEVAAPAAAPSLAGSPTGSHSVEDLVHRYEDGGPGPGPGHHGYNLRSRRRPSAPDAYGGEYGGGAGAGLEAEASNLTLTNLAPPAPSRRGAEGPPGGGSSGLEASAPVLRASQEGGWYDAARTPQPQPRAASHLRPQQPAAAAAPADLGTPMADAALRTPRPQGAGFPAVTPEPGPTPGTRTEMWLHSNQKPPPPSAAKSCATPAWAKGPKVTSLPEYVRLLAYEGAVRTCLGAHFRGVEEAETFLRGDCEALRTHFGVADTVVGDTAREGEEGEPAWKSPRGGAVLSPMPEEAVGIQALQLQLDKVKIVSSKSTWEKLKKLSMNHKGKVDQGHGIRKQLFVRPAKLREAEFVKVNEGQSIRIPLSELQGSAAASDGHAVELLMQLRGGNDASIAQCVEKIPLPSECGPVLGVADQVTRTCHLHKDGEVIAKASVSYRSVAAEGKPGAAERLGPEDPAAEGGFRRISVKQAYDALLRAGLQAIGFNHRFLRIHGPWAWLLDEFARQKALSHEHCTIQYLWWVLQAATPTVDCFHVILECLPTVVAGGGLVQGKLPKYAKGSRLAPQDHTKLVDVLLRVDRLLCQAFSSVKSLSEQAPRGTLDGHQAVPADLLPAPALQLAVQLFNQLHDPLSTYTQNLLKELLHDAAHKRFKCLQRDAEDTYFMQENSGDLGILYQQVGKLCMLLKGELELDQVLHAKNILPSYINFPQLSATQYCEDLYLAAGHTLRKHPPSKPSESVMHLLLAIGGFEAELQRWGLEIPADHQVSDLFKDFVALWMKDDVATLCSKCVPAAIAGPAGAAPDDLLSYDRKARASRPGHVSPVVGEVCSELRHTLEKYRKLIKRWPEWAPSLEKVASKALWELNKALDRSWTALPETAGGRHRNLEIGLAPKSKTWRNVFNVQRAPQFVTRLTKAELLHLNSLKHVLNEIPVLRDTLQSAVGAASSDASPLLGKQFGHVETEYRNVYSKVVSEAVAKLSQGPNSKLHKVLKSTAKAKGVEVERNVKDLIEPSTDETAQILDGHHGQVFEGVWRDMTRGLWNHAAGVVLRFVEKLQRAHDNKENSRWHNHILASEVTQQLEGFFEGVLRRKLGQNLRQRDLDPPRVAKELKERLNTHHSHNLQANSFNVF